MPAPTSKKRAAAAIVAGFLLWGLVWNVWTIGLQKALPDLVAPNAPITDIRILLALIVSSVLLSAIAGFVAGRIADVRAVWIFSAIQLTAGIIAETSYWSLMPGWYHLVFLALVVPPTVFGGTLGARARSRAA